MNRREFLAALSAVATAGCTGTDSADTTTSPSPTLLRDSTATPTSDQTPPTPDDPTPTPDKTPSTPDEATPTPEEPTATTEEPTATTEEPTTTSEGPMITGTVVSEPDERPLKTEFRNHTGQLRSSTIASVVWRRGDTVVHTTDVYPGPFPPNDRPVLQQSPIGFAPDGATPSVASIGRIGPPPTRIPEIKVVDWRSKTVSANIYKDFTRITVTLRNPGPQRQPTIGLFGLRNGRAVISATPTPTLPAGSTYRLTYNTPHIFFETAWDLDDLAVYPYKYPVPTFSTVKRAGLSVEGAASYTN